MRSIRCFPSPVLWVFLTLATVLPTPSQAQEDWLPISAEELALRDHPGNPGAAAIILFREVSTDDVEKLETHHYRIKILSEDGKKYADVTIPYLKRSREVKEIQARSVRPDGTTINFTGRIFDKVIAKRKGIELLAKTFTLPEVQAGSVIEYKYRFERKTDGTLWMIDEELFTRRARFSLRPRRTGGSFAFTGLREILGWNWVLPSGQKPEEKSDGTVLLELEDIPAFRKEEHAPPQQELKRRVEFFYQPPMEDLLRRLQSVNPKKFGAVKGENTTDIFWKLTGVFMHEEIEEFVKKQKQIEKAVAQIASPSDSPEVKLRKLYTRAQQVQHLDYDRPKTEKEEKREKRKENKSAEDVLQHGYGSGYDINRLFLALARAAGFRASLVWLSARNLRFFTSKLLDPTQLNAHVVMVELDSKQLYLDPATRFCPFGFLSWDQTGVQGLRPGPDGGSFIQTPDPTSGQARTERKATLTLDPEGGLSGMVKVAFAGQEAVKRRQDALDRDEAGEREQLEEEVKRWLPAGSAVELDGVVNWEDSEEPLQAKFSVQIRSLGVRTGRRLLLPMGVFQASGKHPFQHVQRTYPVYFEYPYQHLDEVTVNLPPEYEVETLPPPQQSSPSYGRYEISGDKQGGTLTLQRRLVLEGYYYPLEYYPALRAFFNIVRAGDEGQVVLQAVETAQQR